MSSWCASWLMRDDGLTLQHSNSKLGRGAKRSWEAVLRWCKAHVTVCPTLGRQTDAMPQCDLTICAGLSVGCVDLCYRMQIEFAFNDYNDAFRTLGDWNNFARRFVRACHSPIGGAALFRTVFHWSIDVCVYLCRPRSPLSVLNKTLTTSSCAAGRSKGYCGGCSCIPITQLSS